MSPSDNRVDVILDAVKLVRTQLEIRDRRRASEPEERVRAAVTASTTMRRAWWTRAQQADRHSGGAPLVQLVTRLGLEPDEIDMLIVVLVAQLEPDLRDAIVGARASVMTTDAIVDLLFHEPRARLDARRRLTPIAPLARHGLLAIHPRASVPAAQDLEVRPTEALLTFALGRPIEAGPLARYCQLITPLHAWSQVILPERDKQRVWELVAGQPAMRKSLDEWGGVMVPRSRGVVMLFAGPPGTGKSMLAHALAERLGRTILKVHTPSLAAAGDQARVVLAEVLGIAATSGAVALVEDCELTLDAGGPRSLALLEALDHHHAGDGVLILTCNEPATIDAALGRRVDHRLDLAPPDAAARSAIWRNHVPPRAPIAPDVDLDALAVDHVIVGARIRDAVTLALAMMSARGDERLSMAMLRDAAAAQDGRAFTTAERPPS